MDSFSNITQRKRVPSNLQQSKSMTDLSNSHIFDSTMTSLPSTSLDVSQSCCEVLKAEINQLTGELQSANNEIDSLHEENRNLKCELLRCQKIINVYKKLDFIENSPKTSSRKSKRNKLHDSNRESVCLQYNTPEKCIQVPIEEITCTPLVENSDEKTQKDRNSQNGDNMCTLVKNNLEQAHEKESSRTRSPKEAKHRKLCVLSNSTQRGILQAIEENFSKVFKFCSYSFPNSTIKQLLANLKSKLTDYSMNDYCIIFIGETDIKYSNNFIDSIKAINESLAQITHTNIIVCTPTYIRGAPIYNYKVEMFNDLLYTNLQYHDCAYYFDTNYDLTFEFDMFSHKTGILNKAGIQFIFKNIMNRIKIDLELFPITTNTIHESEPNVKEMFFLE